MLFPIYLSPSPIVYFAMLKFQKLPIHQPPEPITSIAIHDSLRKIAVARANASIEIWSRVDVPVAATPTDAHPLENTSFKLTLREAGTKFVTFNGLFWDICETAEVLVATTLSGQFVTFDPSNLRIRNVTIATNEGFYSVARKSVYLEQTMLDGAFGLTPLYAAACGRGTVKVYSSAPAFHLLGTGAKNMHSKRAHCVCFSPNGKNVFVGDDIGCVQRFDTTSLLQSPNVVKPVVTASAVCNIAFDTKKNTVRPAILAMCCSPTLPYLAVGTSNGQVCVIATAQNTVVAQFRAAKASILTLTCVSDEAFIAGSITRDMCTVSFTNEEWQMGRSTRRVHCNDVTCIAASASLIDAITPKVLKQQPKASKGFLCVTGGADGEMFVSSSLPEFEAMFTKSVVEMKQNVIKYRPYVRRSETYCLSRLSGGNHLVTASAKNCVCIWRLPKGGAQLIPFIRFKTAKFGPVRYVAMSRDSSYLMYANSTKVEILTLNLGTKEDRTPSFTKHECCEGGKMQFENIQGLAFGYDAEDGWTAFVVSSNTLYSLRMKDGQLKKRIQVDGRIVQIIAQNHTAVVLTETNGYVAWNEKECSVIHSHDAEFQRLDEAQAIALRPTLHKSADIDGRAQIVDMCFLHTNQWADYQTAPSALVFVSAIGKINVISLAEENVGKTIYSSGDFCPAVYPLPIWPDATPYGVTCIPKSVQKGKLLYDVDICIWNSSHMIRFDATNHYEGAHIVQRDDFVKSLRKDHSEGESARLLSVVPTKRLLAVTSALYKPYKRERSTEENEEKTQAKSAKLNRMIGLVLPHKEFLWGMKVYNAKRYAT